MRTVVGFGLLGASAVVIYGGFTGRLAPMLAALFYPQALTPDAGSSDEDTQPWWSDLVPNWNDLPGVSG